MPKGKRKGKSERFVSSGQATSEEDDFNDNGSVFSQGSEVKSVDEDESAEVATNEAFEVKVSEALEGLTQKSAQGRTNCFEGLCKALIKKYIPDFLYDRRLTLCDAIERGLKKGRGAEQTAAANLASLLCLQLGATEDAGEEVCKNLKPILLLTANEKSAAANARSKCCTALALITFLAGGEMGDVLDLMNYFEAIFSGSYLKGDGNAANVAADLAGLHAAAIGAWGLLFTLLSPGDVYAFFNSNRSSFTPKIDQLSELLLSAHLEVRMAAGEALALVFELGRLYNEDFAEEYVTELVISLQQLATDSNKHRAKKDRKAQRATFRDIVSYIESDQYTEERVKFGTEVLILDNWCRHKQYETLVTALGSGLNTHLTENELLRDIFELGERIILNGPVTAKQTKLERHLVNAAAFKARTISRAKNRDKRSDF